jgi:flagellar basal body-associated protein FliL
MNKMKELLKKIFQPKILIFVGVFLFSGLAAFFFASKVLLPVAAKKATVQSSLVDKNEEKKDEQKKKKEEEKKKKDEEKKKKDEEKKKKEEEKKKEKEEKKKEEKNEKKNEEKKNDGKKEKKKGKKESTVGPMYTLNPLIVNVAGSSARRFLKITIVFELNNETVSEELTKRGPQIYDLLINILSSYKLDELCDLSMRDALRNEMRDRVNLILTEGEIKNVFFSELVIQ